MAKAWIRAIVRSALPAVFAWLGDSLLATPRLDQTHRIRGMWTGSLVIANALIVLLVVIAGVTVMGNPSVQSSYTVKDVAPRLVAGVVLANLSLVLIGRAIGFANALSVAVLGRGVDPRAATRTLYDVVDKNAVKADAGLFALFLATAAVLLAAVLAFLYLARITVTIVLIVVAPLALMCHCLPQTGELARLWWRGLAGVLAIQVAQAVVFVAAVRVVFDGQWYAIWGLNPTAQGYADLWIELVLLYVLIRIPAYISRWLWRGGLSGSPVTRTVKVVATALVLHRVTGKLAGHRTRARAVTK